jgi:hypothetical protein
LTGCVEQRCRERVLERRQQRGQEYSRPRAHAHSCYHRPIGVTDRARKYLCRPNRQATLVATVFRTGHRCWMIAVPFSSAVLDTLLVIYVWRTSAVHRVSPVSTLVTAGLPEVSWREYSSLDDLSFEFLLRILAPLSWLQPADLVKCVNVRTRLIPTIWLRTDFC